ncbi:MAG: LytTR family DNA-binding domain-containing protein [Tannerella sp.]|jgi:DNA-binding LytR/AlgR family response regulator|nr:LytTR family DNA-binding domain-containing protein [Tannerella sp.]
MNVLIVEDETAAFENLKSILMEIDPSIERIEHTESVLQTIRRLNGLPVPELIFMDIHLSDGSAFNIFPAVTVETPVVFTTAYDEYALEAFKVNSIDYLLKPVEPEEIRRALDKFRRRGRREALDYLARLSFLNPAGRYAEKILIPVRNDLIPVDLRSVSCFYGSDGNTRIMLKDGRTYPYGKALENIYASLSPALFFRANKQYIVARDSIRTITVWFDKRLHVTMDTEVPERIFVSKNRAARFKKWLIDGQAEE